MLKSRFNLADSKPKADPDEQADKESERPMYGEHVGEGGEHMHEEEPIIIPPWQEDHPTRHLNKSEISVRLSLLGKTAEGDGYTYLKANCVGMKLTSIISLKCFKHLQFIDVSNNLLTIESLQAITDLPYLVLIHADKNLLNSAYLNRMKYLQVIIMNNNYISSVYDIYQPELCTLEVGYNKISRIAFENRMPTIKCLDFRYNLVHDILDLDFPNLDSLYLAGNKITNLIGLDRLPNLRILHVRNNPIKLLNGFDSCLVKLQYVNLRNCKVSTLKQVKKLRVLPALEALVMRGCPYMGGTGEEDAEVGNEEEDTEVRVEILAALPRLKKINKGVISPEERTEAKDLMMQWLEEGEKDDEEEVTEEQNEEDSIIDD